MKISHPRFLNIGNPEKSDVNFPSCLEKEKTPSQKDADLDTTKKSDTIFHFPEVSFVISSKLYHHFFSSSIIDFILFLGYNNSQGNSLCSTSLVSSSNSWKRVFISDNILRSWRQIYCHAISHFAYTSYFGGEYKTKFI